MPVQKKIIVGDYIDPETGIRFVEDIRGNLHCIHDIHIDAPPVPNAPSGDTINNYETNNYETNNDYVTNNTYNTGTTEHDYSLGTRIVLQSNIKAFTWGSNIDFNRINNSYSPGNFLNYTVPFGKELHILSVVASQFKNGDSNRGISYLGIFRNGILLLALPMSIDVNYEFDSPLRLSASSFVEIKFSPYDKRVDLGIFVSGYLV